MSDVKSTTIVPIAFYCFVLGGYLVCLAGHTAISNPTLFSSNDLLIWLPILASAIFGGGLIFVGMGFLNVNQWSWKILFFSLAICVSCLASLLIAFLIFLMLDLKFLLPYFQGIKTSSLDWFSFLAVFLSEIIVLYYLTQDEVVSNFGDMGPLLSPF